MTHVDTHQRWLKKGLHAAHYLHTGQDGTSVGFCHRFLFVFARDGLFER